MHIVKFNILFITAFSIAKIFTKECGDDIEKCEDDQSNQSHISHIISTTGRCGVDNGNTDCPSGQCCSKYGWCGKGDAYCGNGCQEEYGICDKVEFYKPHLISTDRRCGVNHGNTDCPSGQCCSSYGWCGTSDKYCGQGCQVEYGICNSNKPADYQTIYIYGSCGPDNDGKVCPSGTCCSKHGWCGTGSMYCGFGCQEKYGLCDSSKIESDKGVKSTITESMADKEVKPTTTESMADKEVKPTITITIESNTDKEVKPTTTESMADKEVNPTTTESKADKEVKPTTTESMADKEVKPTTTESMADKEVKPITTESTSVTTESSNDNMKIDVFHECFNDKHWALTFDDGPFEYDDALLDYLKTKNVKATFFINGNSFMDIYSEQGRKIIKRLYAEGHEIGSHTFNHYDLTAHTPEEIIEDNKKLEAALEEIIGVKPAFLRPPYGRGAYEDTVQEIFQSLNYTSIIMWNTDTADWENKGDTEYAISEMKKVVDIGGSMIVVNHNHYYGMTEEKLINSAKAEIEYMLEQGYIAVPISECIKRNPYRN